MFRKYLFIIISLQKYSSQDTIPLSSFIVYQKLKFLDDILYKVPCEKKISKQQPL
jgi:hypothetical protein